MDRDQRLAQLFAKVKDGVVDMPWEKLIDIHAEMYTLLYGMVFDGKTLFNNVQEMIQRYPAIVQRFHTIAKMRGGSLSDNDIQELPRIMVQYNYIQAGKKDFYIYEDLVPMLRDTDLPDMPTTEVKFPFEAFSIVFKQGTIRGRGEKMDRIFVSCPDGKVVSGFLASDNSDGAPIFMANLLPEATLSSLSNRYAETAPGVVEELPTQSAHDAMYLMFNLLLYVNCENADVQRDMDEVHRIREKLAEFSGPKKTRKQKVLEQQYQEAKRRYVYLVGKSVRADAAYGVKAASEEGRKILKRFRVRGHFRNQPYGPERSLVKRRWIAPFWKGPDLAELINSGYVVKESTSGVKDG